MSQTNSGPAPKKHPAPAITSAVPTISERGGTQDSPVMSTGLPKLEKSNSRDILVAVKKQPKKKKISADNSPTVITAGSEQLDLGKNPRKLILELSDEILQVIGDPMSPFYGEIQTMQTVVEATSGKKQISDLEKIIYQTYHKRILEMRVAIKQQQSRKKKKK